MGCFHLLALYGSPRPRPRFSRGRKARKIVRTTSYAHTHTLSLYTNATERSQDVHNMLTTWLWSRRALRTSRAYMLIELVESSVDTILAEDRGDLGGVRHGTAPLVVGQGGPGGRAGWGLELLFVPCIVRTLARSLQGRAPINLRSLPSTPAHPWPGQCPNMGVISRPKLPKCAR